MPQFDFFSFMTQIFWFLLTFYSLYFFILYFILPSYIKTIQLRAKIVTTISLLKKNLNLIKSLIDFSILSVIIENQPEN